MHCMHVCLRISRDVISDFSGEGKKIFKSLYFYPPLYRPSPMPALLFSSVLSLLFLPFLAMLQLSYSIGLSMKFPEFSRNGSANRLFCFSLSHCSFYPTGEDYRRRFFNNFSTTQSFLSPFSCF